MLLLQGSEGLFHLTPRMALSLSFIMGISDPLLSHINLLGDLHNSGKGIIYIYIIKKKMMMMTLMNEGDLERQKLTYHDKVFLQ